MTQPSSDPTAGRAVADASRLRRGGRRPSAISETSASIEVRQPAEECACARDRSAASLLLVSARRSCRRGMRRAAHRSAAAPLRRHPRAERADTCSSAAGGRRSSSAGTAAWAPARTRPRSRPRRRSSRLQRRHPNITPQVRGRHVRRRPRHAGDPDRVRQRARHRRSGRCRWRRGLPRPVARPRRRSSRRPGYDLVQFDQGAVDFYKIGDVQDGIPFAIYPSMLWYKAEPVRGGRSEPPPHEYGEKYTMPDGTEVDWNYDTVQQLALMLTVDANGKDATQDGLRSREDRPVRLRAAARRPARHGRLLRGRSPRRRRIGTTVDHPGCLGGRLEVLVRRDVDSHFTLMTGPSLRARTSAAAATRSSRDGWR